MGLTLSELHTLTRQRLNEKDVNNTHFTNAEITQWVNLGQQFIAVRLGQMPKVITTLTAAAGNISYSGSIIAPQSAHIKNADGDYEKLRLMSEETLEALHPGWLNADTGAPSILIRTNYATFRLFPAPDSDYLGNDIRIRATETPTAMVSDTDESELPDPLHPELSNYACYEACQMLSRHELAVSFIKKVTGSTKSLKNILTRSQGENSAAIPFINHDN